MNGGDWLSIFAVLGWGISRGVLDPFTGFFAIPCAWFSRRPWLPVLVAVMVAIFDTYMLPVLFARFGDWVPWVIAGRIIGAILQGMILSGIAVAIRKRIARNKESESST